MQPLLQTAGFMHREYGFPNIGERMGIGSKLKTEPKVVYLRDVQDFCDALREQNSHLEVGACLQGLAGLQLLEALRLQWKNVDLNLGLIEITGETKNTYRNRVIPVCGRVLEALRRAEKTRRARKDRVLRVVEHVVVGERGQSYEDFTSYSRQMGNAIRAWNGQCGWAPKDLRNCLPTLAVMEGIHGTVWEQYIGHAPKTVTERHYVPRLSAATAGESEALQRQMDLFRRFVVQPVEDKLASGSCKILQLHGNEPSEGAS
jgi:integrase